MTTKVPPPRIKIKRNIVLWFNGPVNNDESKCLGWLPDKPYDKELCSNGELKEGTILEYIDTVTWDMVNIHSYKTISDEETDLIDFTIEELNNPYIIEKIE